ncbi:MAG: ATP-binding protein [Steroidobacteraceae bacterium]
MNSLRRRLIASLWLALLVVGTVSAAFTYLQTRQDTDGMLDYQMEQVATFLGARAFGAPSSQPMMPRLHTDHDIEEDYIVDVRDASGQVLYATPSAVQIPRFSWLGFRVVKLGGIDYRVFSAASIAQRITVAQQMQLRRETAAAAAFAALLPVGLLIPVLGLIIGVVIRRQLKPLSETARAVAARPPVALDALPVSGLPTEVRPLIEEINRLLARVAAANENERRFIADAAHALRTPLAALQLQADVLDGSQDVTERAARVTELRAGIRRAVRLSQHLLTLARSDSAHRSSTATAAVDPAIAEAFHVYGPIAAANDVELYQAARCDAEVASDPRDLGQVIGNLLDNALRYTASGGRVTVSAAADTGGVMIEITDEGPGLPESELEKVFHRFYRSPGDATEGSGLGLAVVRGIVQRLGGRVQLANRGDRSGLIASVWLPTVHTAAH